MRNEKKSCCCCSEASAPETSAAEVSAPAAADCCAQAETEPAACCRHKDRTPAEHKALLNRLSRIEGQVRGIRGMVENSAYCPDILTQVAATSAAINAFTKELLASHIRTCVADDIRAGHDEAIDELVQTLQKLMK